MVSAMSYFDPSAPASFSGASTFRRHQAEYSYNELADILSGYRAYTLHRPARKRFPRNSIITGGIDHLWETDLSDLSKFSKKNDHVKFLMCVIDAFSKYAWVLPLKTKSAPDILEAWKKLFRKTDRRPKFVRSDKGSEFVNKLLKHFFKENGISFYTSQNDDVKCSIVERFQRTWKSKLSRMMTHMRSERYVDKMDDLTASYNATYHRSIGYTPKEVNKANEAKVWHRLYGKIKLTRKKPKFKVNDRVKIKLREDVFRKGFNHQYTEEDFIIDKVLRKQNYVYQLKDLNSEPIIGTFYQFELIKVKNIDDVFIIEKVLKTRRRNNKTEYFVKFLGYSNKFNSWVDDISA